MKLFPGSKITKGESTALILWLIQKLKLPEDAIPELLAIFNAVLPRGTNVPTSLDLLEKSPKADISHLIRLHFSEDPVGN
jgi:hypothetical protein